MAAATISKMSRKKPVLQKFPFRTRFLTTFVSIMDYRYYHICSDGNYASVLFRDEAAFKAAMNRVAVCALKTGVRILAFVLMDNHFHFVAACGSEDDCVAFVNMFKRLTGKYNWDEYGERASVKMLPVKLIPVKDADYLRVVIAYVLKNPTKARIGMFYDYPWGSGNLYFARAKATGIPAGVMGPYTVRKLCRTRVRIPDHWIIQRGIILPSNYVEVGLVEKLYKTTRAYMYSLSQNADETIEQDMGEWSAMIVSDVEMRQEREILMKKMFSTISIRALSAPQRLSLARAMRTKLRCSKKQIARAVHLPYETVEKLL